MNTTPKQVNRTNFVDMYSNLGIDLYDEMERQHQVEMDNAVSKIKSQQRDSSWEDIRQNFVELAKAYWLIVFVVCIVAILVQNGCSYVRYTNTKSDIKLANQLQSCKSGDLLGCQMAIKDAKDTSNNNQVSSCITAYVIAKGVPPPPLVGTDPYYEGLTACRNGQLLNCQMAIKSYKDDQDAVKVFSTAYVIATGNPPPPLVGDALPTPTGINGFAVSSTSDGKGVVISDKSGHVVSTYDPK